jgi:hypothetical protein
MHGRKCDKLARHPVSFSYRSYRQFVPWKDNDEPSIELRNTDRQSDPVLRQCNRSRGRRMFLLLLSLLLLYDLLDALRSNTSGSSGMEHFQVKPSVNLDREMIHLCRLPVPRHAMVHDMFILMVTTHAGTCFLTQGCSSGRGNLS